MALRWLIRTALFTLCSGPLVLAQPGAKPPTPEADKAPLEATPAEEPPPEPNLPQVTDPMLEPLPPAKHVLGSWQEALRLIKSRSSQLAISGAQIEASEGQVRQALARSLPTLTGTGTVTRHLLRGEGQTFDFSSGTFRTSTIPDPSTTWGAGLALRTPVLAPQAWHDYGTAKRNRRAAKLNHADTQRVVLAQVADNIVQVVTAERLSEVSRVALKSSLSTLDLNRRRAKLGAASALDVLRAEQEVTLTRSDVVSADENLRRARENLGLALGSSEPYGVVPSIRPDARSVCRPVDSPETRADVKAARTRLDVAERNIKSVDLGFLPTVDFVSNLNYLSNERATANGNHVTWTIGGVLTWQLYDGGLRYGAKATARAERRIAEEQLTAAKRQVRLEILQAQRAVDVAQQNLAVTAKSRELAAEGARLARIAFLSGRGNSFDLIDADRRLRSAELELAVKEFGLVRAQIAALLALSTCDV
jgi:outer membrane protein TolC